LLLDIFRYIHSLLNLARRSTAGPSKPLHLKMPVRSLAHSLLHYYVALAHSELLERMITIVPYPDQELIADLYEATVSTAARAGYQQYEISNYAKPGHECRYPVLHYHGKSVHGVFNCVCMAQA